MEPNHGFFDPFCLYQAQDIHVVSFYGQQILYYLESAEIVKFSWPFFFSTFSPHMRAMEESFCCTAEFTVLKTRISNWKRNMLVSSVHVPIVDWV
jgi:hypothetical protein